MLRFAVLLLLYVTTAHAAPRDYVGVEACKTCHAATVASWSKTAHARAATTLGARARDGRCLTCHGTGEGVSSRALRPGVQCEACHGGGAAYAAAEDLMRDLPLARVLGLSADPMASCARCHTDRARTSPGKFDPVAAWAKIAH